MHPGFNVNYGAYLTWHDLDVERTLGRHPSYDGDRPETP
jgi:hypothetical protein